MTGPIDFEIDLQNFAPMMSILSGLERQIPFIIMTTINRTAEEVLADARQQILEKFIVRVPRFDLPPTQLPKAWRATKERLFATVNIGDDDNGKAGIGSRRVQIFSKFETNGRKVATDPDYPIAIPTRAIRSSPQQLVPRSLYPTSLRLAPRKDVNGSTLLAKRKGKVRGLLGEAVTSKKKRAEMGLVGIGGTFEIRRDGRPIGIFQRVGTGHGQIREIWAYRQSIHIPDRLDVRERGTAIIDARLTENFYGALELAVRTTSYVRTYGGS